MVRAGDDADRTGVQASSARLTAAQTIPGVLAAYQEWLNEWADAVDQDSHRLVSDSKRVVDESVRYFTMPSSGATT